MEKPPHTVERKLKENEELPYVEKLEGNKRTQPNGGKVNSPKVEMKLDYERKLTDFHGQKITRKIKTPLYGEKLEDN